MSEEIIVTEATEAVVELGEAARLFMLTPFEEYTVTEGLLLCIFVLLLILVFLELIHWR